MNSTIYTNKQVYVVVPLQPVVDTDLAVPEELQNILPTSAKHYQKWDLVELTQNYFKMLLHHLLECKCHRILQLCPPRPHIYTIKFLHRYFVCTLAVWWAKLDHEKSNKVQCRHNMTQMASVLAVGIYLFYWLMDSTICCTFNSRRREGLYTRDCMPTTFLSQ